MENVFNSNANIVYQVINFMGILASSGCVAMIVYAVVKIVTGDESDHQRYLKRIRNGIIALILIITSTQVVGLVTKYFNPNINGETSIGSFRKYQGERWTLSTNGEVSNDMNDKDGRKMIIYGDQVYVRTKENVKQRVSGGLFGGNEVFLDQWKLYSDCQGWTGGTFAETQFWTFVDRAGNWMPDETRDYYRNWIFSNEAYKNKNELSDEEDFKSFMEQNAAKWDKYTEFTEENNPYTN